MMRTHLISQYFQNVARNFETLAESAAADIETATNLIILALQQGKKVIFCGNGGSAADSQHLAAELMGRYLQDRDPLPALALTVDTSALTAIGNDYGYENVFSRQLKGIGAEGDVLIGISTSGNSKNVVRALEVAEELGLVTIGFTGKDGGAMKDLCDVCIRVPSTATNHIQEMHIALGHMICGFVEQEMVQGFREPQRSAG